MPKAGSPRSASVSAWRVAARLPGFASAGAAWLGLILVCLWLVGKVVSDRFLWTQYLSWSPTIAVAFIAVALATASFGLARLAGTRSARRRSKSGRGLRRAAVAVALIVTLWWLLVECRVHALISRAPLQEAAAEPGGLRILHWNPSSYWGADLKSAVNGTPSDLALITNPTWAEPMTGIEERYRSTSLILSSSLLVFSRAPILRWGMSELGFKERSQAPIEPGNPDGLRETQTGPVDPGRAYFLELDTTTQLGRPIVLWVIDLPSSLGLSRWEVAEQTRAVLAQWSGRTMRPVGGGVSEVVATDAVGFPTPDVVIGDFNIPRGSASLRRLLPDMSNAYDQGGAGYTASFPRLRPLWHIDQAFVARWLKAADYRLIDTGQSRHAAQWVRVVAR